MSVLNSSTVRHLTILSATALVCLSSGIKSAFSAQPGQMMHLQSKSTTAHQDPATPAAQGVVPGRVLKFSGVPISEAQSLKSQFPFVFERPVTLAEVDEIVRWMMVTGRYANIEVVTKPESANSELTLVASILRHIRAVSIQGGHVFSSIEIRKVLNVNDGEVFERKELLAAADELRLAYQKAGYHNAKVEIDFKLPNDNDVQIAVTVTEGAPLRVRELVVETGNPELASKLKYMASRFKGKTLGSSSLVDFEKTVNEYFQDNRFLLAKLSQPTIVYNANRTEAKVSYSVENPWRYEFYFTGNQYFSDGHLLDHFDLDKYAGAASSPAPVLAEKVRRMYETAGFTNVDVNYKEKNFDKTYRHEVTFTVKEGPRVRVNKVAISGNLSRPEDYYANFIQASNSDLTGAGFYNRKDVEDGAKRLITELQNQGYLRAKVLSQHAEFSKDKSKVDVQLQVDEGPLTQIREIRFDGVESFPKAELLDLLTVKSGQALGLSELEESIGTIKNFYRDHGFLEMRLLNENDQDRIVTYNETNTQATVVFQIHEGPKIIVKSVQIEGNTFTKNFVIERELRFKTGDVLTPESLDRSVSNLQKLGLFSKVEIKTEDEGTDVAERIVHVKLGDRDPGLFLLGFGVNNDQTSNLNVNYRGYLGLGYRNLGGTGRGLSFRADVDWAADPVINFFENHFTLSYLEPYIFNSSNRLRVNLVHEQYWPSFQIDKDLNPIIQENNTASFLLERDLARHIKLTMTAYSFSNQRAFDRKTYSTLVAQNVAKVGPLVEFDYRDDLFTPTRGSYSYVDFEYSDPILGSSRSASQTIQFFKSNIASTVYSPINKSHSVVWANSVRSGYVANLSDRASAGIPLTEQFFIGGRSTIRGYDGSETIPNVHELIPNVPNPQLTSFMLTNDSYFYLVKTELRFPLWKNSPAGELNGGLFYDGGSVVINQPGVNLVPAYRHSVGIGIRLATPVGPANLEYAWKLDWAENRNRWYNAKNSYYRESPGAFHFSIGTF